MKAFLLCSTGCLLLFYSLYAIYLKRLSFHAWNRFYLIATLLISLFIPFLSFPTTNYIPIRSTIEEVLTTQPTSMPGTPNGTLNTGPDFNWLAGIYWMGVFVTSLLFIISAIKLYNKIRSSTHEKQDGVAIIRTTDLNASFFRYIFMQQNLDPEEEKIVFLHEKVHQQQLHSLDNLLLELVKIICWFNPLVYMYGRMLKAVHELEADQLVSGQVEKTVYAQLLLKFNTKKGSGLLNLYSIHPLKRRIHSLFTDKTNRMKKALYLLVLPCLALAISSFAFITNKLPDALLVKSEIIINNELPAGVLIKSDSTQIMVQLSLRELLGPSASWAAFENFEAGTFEKLRMMFKERGYELSITEKVQGSNESIQLLGFKVEAPATGVAGSATYSVNEMISKGYYLLLSFDKEKQVAIVSSSNTAKLK